MVPLATRAIYHGEQNVRKQSLQAILIVAMPCLTLCLSPLEPSYTPHTLISRRLRRRLRLLRLLPPRARLELRPALLVLQHERRLLAVRAVRRLELRAERRDLLRGGVGEVGCARSL